MVQKLNLSRRRLFGLGAALVAAPAIVRVSALMPISAPKVTGSFTADELKRIAEHVVRFHERRMIAALDMYEHFVDQQLAASVTPAGLGIVNGVTPKIDRRALSFWKNTATA